VNPPSHPDFFASLVSLLLAAIAFLAMICEFTDPVFALRCMGRKPPRKS
jgi:hypothetical protein